LKEGGKKGGRRGGGREGGRGVVLVRTGREGLGMIGPRILFLRRMRKRRRRRTWKWN